MTSFLRPTERTRAPNGLRVFPIAAERPDDQIAAASLTYPTTASTMLLKPTLPLLTSMILCCAVTAANAQPTAGGYSSDEIAIAGAVTARREDNAGLAKACAERRPAVADNWSAAEFFWESDEFQVLRAANRIGEAMHAPMAANEQRARDDAKTQLARIAAQGGDAAVDRVCGAMFARLTHQKGAAPYYDDDTRTRMLAIDARIPGAEHELRDHGFKIGCMKALFVHGQHDLAATEPRCDCATRLLASLAAQPDKTEFQLMTRSPAEAASSASAPSADTQARMAACMR